MAKLYPDIDNINRLTVSPTEGERHLLMILRDTLDDTYEIYFNSYLDGDRPDVIVIKPDCGALIIEVKDWSLSHYQLDINNRWSYEGKLIRSPQQQVFRYKENMFNLHLPVLGLQHLANRNFYKIISVSVYFHCADRNQLKNFYDTSLNAIRSKILELNRERLVIGQEKYDLQMDWFERARYKLERDLGISWGFDNLTKKIRLLDKMNKTPLFSSDIHEDFKRRLLPPEHTKQQGTMVAFDAKQAALTLSSNGFSKIKGVAGCGKTTILAQKAINAHARHLGQVLILTFNITLRHYIRDTINRLLGSGNWNQFEIIHYHAFISNQLNNYGVDLKSKMAHLTPNQRNDIDVIYGMRILFDGIETEKYQTILIDEVQDYAPDWIKLIRDCFLVENGEMVLFGDQSQNIYSRPSDERASPIVKGFGEWIKLKKSYRTDGDAPLLELFKNFQLQQLVSKYADTEIFEAKMNQTSIHYDLLSYETYGEKYDAGLIFEKIQNYIHEYKLHPNDIAIVSSKVNFLIPLNEAFKQIEKTKVMFEDASEVAVITSIFRPDTQQFQEELDKIRRRKKCFFMQNSGLIKISTIHSFKGLQAQTVFCILAAEDEAEMVYTGITRAQRNLVIFDSATSNYKNFFKLHTSEQKLHA